MDRLPANMDDLRTTYRGFIHRWGYLREHQISNLADPNEIVQHVFKNPRDAYELYTEATPEQQEQLQERFVQYAWGDLPTTSPNADIAKTVRSRLAPYMRDPKTARAMLGGRAGQAYRNMVMWAKHAPDLSQSLEKSPQWRQAFGESFQRYFLKRGLSPADATQRAMAYLMLQLPGAEGATARVAGQTSLPAVNAGRHGVANMLAGRHGAMAAFGMAMGRPEAAMYQLAMAGSWMAHSQGFTAASKLKVTRFFLNAFKETRNPMRAGALFARALDMTAHTGAQAMRLSTNSEPVEFH
jgi:hypothetical protein